VGVGIFTGVGAVALRSLIGLIHNAMFDAARAADVVGVITKRAIADAVINEYED
jgi:hypothetical protein